METVDGVARAAALRADTAVEPPPTSFRFPSVTSADDRGRVVVGGDLEPGTILAAYRAGLFPMRQGDGRLAWWSPDPRGILLPDELHVSESLRRALRRFELRIDTAFDAVVAACAQRPTGEYEWITDEVRGAYGALHRLGWAHSVEAWARPTEGGPLELVGGLYGVSIGGFFGGESMFHRRRDASKAALVGLVDALAAGAGADRFIDVQWLTPHLASLGARAVPRDEYLRKLELALHAAVPPAFERGGAGR